MMRRAIVLLLLWAVGWCGCLAAQVQGTVRSDKGEPLAGAMVKAVGADGGVLAYAIADNEGRYTIQLEPLPEPLRLVFSCMGYAALTLTVDNPAQPVDVRLSEKAFELKEVVVKVPPIRALGDTLLYDVASFRSQADRSIEDVIKRLPGIEVQDNGRIFYNGEAINKFYIENLDLLGGRYAIATRNISPDDIASVSVYENHQPVQALKDLKVSDRAALNLTLKRQRMLKPIGYVKGGAGWGGETKWQGELFGMLVSPKNQTLVTAKGNNFGEAYRNETQQLIGSLFDTKTLAYGLFAQLPFGEAQIPQSRYFQNRSATASVNTLQKLREHLTLTVTADYLRDKDSYRNTQVTEYYASGNQPVRVVEAGSSELDGHEANLSLKVENNAAERYVVNELRFKGRFNANRYLLSNEDLMEQTLRNRDYNVSNDFSAVFRKERRVYEARSLVSVSSTPSNAIRAVYPARDSVGVSQWAEGFSFHTRESTGFSWLAGARSSVGADLSFESFYETFRSEGGQGRGEEARFVNDDSGYKLVTSAEPYFQWKGDWVTWRTSVPVRMYDLKYRDVWGGGTYALHKPYVELRTTFYFFLPRNVKATLEGGRRYAIGGMEDFVVQPVYVTYRQQSTIGAGILGVRRSDYVSASLRHRNAVEGLFCSLRGMFSRTVNNRMGTTEVDEDQTTTGQVQARHTGYNADVMANVSKNVRAWNTTFSLMGSAVFLKRTTQRQGRVLDIKNRMYTLRGEARGYLWADRVSFSLDGEYVRTSQASDALLSSVAVDDVTAHAGLSFFPFKSFEVFVQAYYNNAELSGSGRQANVFVDGGVRYSVGKFDVECTGRNLTDRRVYAYTRLSNYDLYTYSFALRPLECLFTLKYNF